MKTVFVTGGSGYIGRNLIGELVARKYKIKALARSEKSAKIVRDLGAEAVIGDMFANQALIAGMKGADILFHLAADTTHNGKSKAQEKINLDGTRTVYLAAQIAGIKRAVHLSTEAVLLEGKPLVYANEQMPYPKKFAGSYSYTKAKAEQIALSFNSEDMQVLVMRPRFVWGRDDTTAMPQLLHAARSGKLAWIGGGDYLTETTHIANVIHGLFSVLDKGKAGEIYFITDGEPISFRTFITELLATQNQKVTDKSVPRFLVKNVVVIGEILAKITGGCIKAPMSFQEYATLGVPVTIDISKAKEELGYQPIITREQGLAELRQD